MLEVRNLGRRSSEMWGGEMKNGVNLMENEEKVQYFVTFFSCGSRCDPQVL